MNFEDELQEKSTPLAPEREISLGTGTILAIFLALTLICAAFFGFGYAMGRRSEKAVVAAAPENTTAAKSDSSPFSGFKAAPVAEAPETPLTGAPAPQPTADATPDPAKATPTGNANIPDTGGTVVQPSVSADGAWMVQVSATTRKPDAEALSKMLVRQGFTTSIRSDLDGKFHVRVGPFAAKKDADITRKLLIANGYKDPFIAPK